MPRGAYVVTRTRGGEDQDLVALGTGHWSTRTLDGRVSPHATVFLNRVFAEDAVAVIRKYQVGPFRLTRVDPHNFPIGTVRPAGADEDDNRKLALDAAVYNGELYHADPNCKHEVTIKWSGVECRKCGGWFC